MDVEMDDVTSEEGSTKFVELGRRELGFVCFLFRTEPESPPLN